MGPGMGCALATPQCDHVTSKMSVYNKAVAYQRMAAGRLLLQVVSLACLAYTCRGEPDCVIDDLGDGESPEILRVPKPDIKDG